ncbi:amino acid starvation-responsive transcription factor GCN4 SCDLUD_005148 [Saccharomycodes ludwigii]|nr:hypothetical protein SCDLUD_005148 [Saccharomycodes ludwigii]KAH3898810.1 hypothetical protein SCDLUD_005148 [Saccharomycodes ludwigii]
MSASMYNDEQKKENTNCPNVVGELVFNKFAKIMEGPEHSEYRALYTGTENTKNDIEETEEWLNFEYKNSPAAGTVKIENEEEQLANEALINGFLSCDSSPMLEIDNVDDSNPETWTCLFDDEPMEKEDSSAVVSSDVVGAANPKGGITTTTGNGFLPTPVLEDDLEVGCSDIKLKTITTKKVNKKVDHLGIVAYNRRNRSTSLKPIELVSEDPAALKRAKNTEAARRSRARKAERMSQLEAKVEELLARNSALEEEVLRLRSMLGE